MMHVNYQNAIEFPLSNGEKTLIDADDYEKISSFGKWYKSTSGYAVKKTRINGKNVSYRMHRVINDTPDGMVTDHINGNKLDNRKSNLRNVSQAVNSQNRTSPNKRTVYKDLPPLVTFDHSRGKYLATYTQRKRFDDLQDAINFTKGNK